MPGGRVQTQYQGGGQQLQNPTIPELQSEKAHFDPNDSGAFQLAKALGALPTETFNRQVEAVASAKMTEDRQEAEKYANSMTMDELGKKIKSGEMLPSHSPAFSAALQHIWGENTQQTFERDTLSKIQRGELKFNSQEEMDKYITDHRNEALSGQSQYAVAGFDKGYGTFREKTLNANQTLLNTQATERGLQEANDKLGNDVLKVTSPEFKGTPDDAAKTILQSYKLLTSTSLLRDDAKKAALEGVATNIASGGRKELTEAFLNQKVDNGTPEGTTVRSLLGETKAASLVLHADTRFKEAENQRVDVELRPWAEKANKGELDEKGFKEWVGKNERFVRTPTVLSVIDTNQAAILRAQKALEKGKLEAASIESEAAANQAVSVAAANGTVAFLPPLKVLSHTGEMKDFDVTAAAQKALSDRAQRDKMTLQQATKMYATNDVVNTEWQTILKSGVGNISSVGQTYDGKNIGKLNPQGQKALEMFFQIDTADPRYAKKLLAPKEYDDLSDLKFLVEKGGFPDLNQAATVLNQARQSGVTERDYGSMKKGVAEAVKDIVDPHWYSGIPTWWHGLWGGNTEPNLTSISNVISRRAELLVQTGQVKDPKQAVQDTVRYLSDPKVTTNVNGEVYFNHVLPAVPAGENPGELFGRFIKEVPSKLATDQKMPGNVRLEPNAFGGYTAWLGGTPLTDKNNQMVMYRQEEVSKWIDGALKGDLRKATAEKNYDLWVRRVEDEYSKSLGPDALPGRGQGFLYNVTSRAQYERFLKNGHADKPAKELIDIHKSYKGK